MITVVWRRSHSYGVIVKQGAPVPRAPCFLLELGNITILSFIMILKCHDNQYRKEIFSIVISGSTILS